MACLKIDQLHVAYESLGNSSNYSTLSCWIVDTNVEISHEVDSGQRKCIPWFGDG